jgi:hypothetical protein
LRFSFNFYHDHPFQNLQKDFIGQIKDMGWFLVHFLQRKKGKFLCSVPGTFPLLLSTKPKKGKELNRKKAQCQTSRNSSGSDGTPSETGSCCFGPADPPNQRCGPECRREDPPVLSSVKKALSELEKTGRLSPNRKPTVRLIFAIFSAIFKVTKEGAFAGSWTNL